MKIIFNILKNIFSKIFYKKKKKRNIFNKLKLKIWKEVEILSCCLNKNTHLDDKFDIDILKSLEIREYIKNGVITKEGYFYLEKNKKWYIPKIIKNVYFLLSIILIFILSFLNIINLKSVYSQVVLNIPGINIESINNFTDFLKSKSFDDFYLKDIDIEELDGYSFPCSEQNDLINKTKCKIIFKDDENIIIGYFKDNKIVNNSFGIALVEYKYFEKDYDIYIKEEKNYGHNWENDSFYSVKNAIGCYKTLIEYTNNGKILFEECLGLNDERINNFLGYSKKIINYINSDNDSILSKISFLGINGELINSSHEEGIYAIKEEKRDKYNNLIEERFFGDNNHSIGLKDYFLNQIYYGKRYEYYGNNIITRLLDEYNYPLMSDGITIIDEKSDNSGNLIKRVYRGKNLDIINNREGVSILRKTYYENGDIKSEEYFGNEGMPINNIYGYHSIKYFYNKTNISEIKIDTYYDKNGNLILGNDLNNIDGNFITYNEYDLEGNLLFNLLGYTNKIYKIYKYIYEKDHNGDYMQKRYECTKDNLDIINSNNLVLSEIITNDMCQELKK